MSSADASVQTSDESVAATVDATVLTTVDASVRTSDPPVDDDPPSRPKQLKETLHFASHEERNTFVKMMKCKAEDLFLKRPWHGVYVSRRRIEMDAPYHSLPLRLREAMSCREQELCTGHGADPNGKEAIQYLRWKTFKKYYEVENVHGCRIGTTRTTLCLGRGGVYRDYSLARLVAAAFAMDPSLRSPESAKAWLMWMKTGGDEAAKMWLQMV